MIIFRFYVSILAVLALSTVVLSQIEATTTSGKKVILKADGTWKYIEAKPAPDSVPDSDCSKWIVSGSDKMTGDSYHSSKGPIISSADGGKSGMSIMTMKTSNGLALSFTVAGSGSGCIDKGASINFLFTDGSRLELANETKFNCDGDSVVFFGDLFGKTNELNTLKTKQIETIRVSTMKSFVQRDLTPEQAKRLMNELSCLDKVKS